jgi:HPt (histidine-containing phosphotransfer) domain-containing protein
MDLYMPEMDGIPATTAIRALPAWDQIPIVAVTADPGPEERARCLAAGMNGFLAKPFRPEELFAAVEGWVEASLRDPPRKVAEDSDPVDIAAFRVELEGAGVASAVDGLLAVFKGDAPGRMVALESALGSGDLVAIRLAAHAYKSAAGAVRATRLAALLGRIERAALEGSVTDATNLGAACREAHGEVLSFLGD